MTTATAVIYTTRPNYERKGIAELAEHGVHAFTHYDESGKRAKVTAPGYIFANRNVQAAFLRHVRSKPMGRASLADIGNLYVQKPAPAPAADPLKVGDKVRFNSGAFFGKNGLVTSRRGRRQWLVEVEGRQICAQTASLIRIDPG